MWMAGLTGAVGGFCLAYQVSPPPPCSPCSHLALFALQRHRATRASLTCTDRSVSHAAEDGRRRVAG